MKLYVANASKQIQEFVYRTEKGGSAYRQLIPIAQQVMLSADLDADKIDYLLKPHRKYGVVSLEDAERGRGMHVMVYSIDKAVPAAKLLRIMERNSGVLMQLGKQYRQEASVAQNNVMEADLQEKGRPEVLRAFETSIVEENHDERDPTPPIAEGTRVTRMDDHGRPNGGNRRNNRRAA